MEAIRYMRSAKDDHNGIWIDLSALKKTIRKKKDLSELMEEIEDIVAIELSKTEKSFPYEDTRRQILRKKK